MAQITKDFVENGRHIAILEEVRKSENPIYLFTPHPLFTPFFVGCDVSIWLSVETQQVRTCVSISPLFSFCFLVIPNYCVPTLFAGMKVESNALRINDTARYLCSNGYELKGKPEIKCEGSSSHSGNLKDEPNCVSKFSVPLVTGWRIQCVIRCELSARFST